MSSETQRRIVAKLGARYTHATIHPSRRLDMVNLKQMAEMFEEMKQEDRNNAMEPKP